MKEDHFTRSGSAHSLLWVMLLSLTIIILAIVSSYLRYNKTLSDYKWLNHSSDVMREISGLKSIMAETESSIRSYLITGSTGDIPDLNSNFKSAGKQLNIVRSLTTDNPVQQQLCDSVLSLIQKRYVIFESSVAGKNSGNDSLVRANVEEGKNIMIDFTSTIDRMYDNEYQLGNERAYSTTSGAKYTPILLLVASAISSFFIIFAYLMLVRVYAQSVSLQQKLTKNVRDLHHSNKELEQFAFIASHDLQEPLRKLRSFSNLLSNKEAKNLSLEGQDILLRIDSSATRMQTLIDDLLTLSKMISKPIQIDKVDLNVIADEVKADMLEVNKEKEIIIRRVELPVINGYSNSLRRLFQNVFSNSIKYARPGGRIEIGITSKIIEGRNIPMALESEKKRSFYQISITDNGIGFENKYAEQIFNIFKRLHNRTEYSGTGIGLAICKRVVENHEGYMNATGEPGVGATFNIYLPVT